MPFLDEITTGSGDPQVTTLVASSPVVEPLGGPKSPADLMDRFPAAVYAQGTDTHLYKLIETLCGDAGAGLLQKQTYIARLQGEAEILSFKDLDTFYTQHFRFNRIRPEIYSLDADTQSMTQAELDDVRLKDDRYKHRVQDFFNATRLGNSPSGMALAAKAGSGVEVEVRENYKAIFDKYSDLPLGLRYWGQSQSVFEFVLMPRLDASGGVLNDEYAFEAENVSVVNVTFPVPGTAARPQTYTAPVKTSKVFMTKPDYIAGLALIGETTEGWYYLSPDIHRNMLDVLDRLRPVGALMTVLPQPFRHLVVGVSGVGESSERMSLARFVNGRSDVNWPAVDRVNAFFVQGGIENEAQQFADSAVDLPVVFHTIESVTAYTDHALNDPYYNTSQFYVAPDTSAPAPTPQPTIGAPIIDNPFTTVPQTIPNIAGNTTITTAPSQSPQPSTIAPAVAYSSEHVGVMSKEVRQVYVWLEAYQQQLADYARRTGITFGKAQSLALNNTLLFVKGQWRSK